jgi:hypothetical protein
MCTATGFLTMALVAAAQEALGGVDERDERLGRDLQRVAGLDFA